MNISRRDFLAGAGALGASAALSGCKTTPSEEAARKLGVAFGGTTGFVLEQFDLEPKVRNAVVDIVNRGYTVVPAEGQTVFAAWKEVAQRHVAALIADEKITAMQGDLILTAFDLVLKGLSLLIERKPEIGTYGAIALAAIGGFCDGFLAVYKPVDPRNGDCPDCGEVTVDARAFRALRESAELGRVRVQAAQVRPYPSRGAK